MGNGTCSGLEITIDDKLRYFLVWCSKFHLAGNISGSPKYSSTCYSLTYKQTGGITTANVETIFPAVIFNYNILPAANVHREINLKYMNYDIS